MTLGNLNYLKHSTKFGPRNEILSLIPMLHPTRSRFVILSETLPGLSRRRFIALQLSVEAIKVVHPRLGCEAGVCESNQPFLEHPDEHPPECPYVVLWSSHSYEQDHQRRVAGRRRRQGSRHQRTHRLQRAGSVQGWRRTDACRPELGARPAEAGSGGRDAPS